MALNHRCCFCKCKFKHEALIVVLDHMAKQHKLKINGKPIYVKSYSAIDTVEEGQ